MFLYLLLLIYLYIPNSANVEDTSTLLTSFFLLKVYEDLTSKSATDKIKTDLPKIGLLAQRQPCLWFS